MPDLRSCSRCSVVLTDSADGLCPGCRTALGLSTPRSAETPVVPIPDAAPTLLFDDPPPEAPTATADGPAVALAAAPTVTRHSGPRPAGPAAPAATPPPATRFTLGKHLGSGGMGDVYEAVQTGTGRTVAVKLLPLAAQYRPGSKERFATEGKALARLTHPNVVQVFEVGEADGKPFLLMEYVDKGWTLAHRLKTDGPLPPAEAARVLAAAARGIAAAHAAGVLHRDMKPANVLLAPPAGTPKVADFGVAKLLDAGDGITRTGVLIGTPAYMAPEQAAERARDVDQTADVYGLGATLYECLTGRPPFKGEDVVQTLRLVLNDSPTPPSKLRPEVQPELEAVCLKCLEKEPAKRYASAAELADDLDRWLTGEPTHARPLTRWGKVRRFVVRRRTALAVAVTVVLLAVAAGAVYRETRPQRQIERELNSGRKVTLVGETGLPRWWKWVYGDVVLAESTVGDGTSGFQTNTVSLLQLAGDPGIDSYRLTADLRHIRMNDDTGSVGLFVGHDQFPTPSGYPAVRWVAVHFSDFRLAAVRKNPALAARHGLDGRDFLVARTPGKDEASRADYGSWPFRPQDRDLNDWRTIRMDVTPLGVEVSWRDDGGGFIPALSVPRQKIDDMPGLHTQVIGRRVPGFDLAPQGWSTRKPLGIFAQNSVAAFRNVTLEPMPGPPES